MTEIPHKFDAIRPYTDAEVSGIVNELLSDRQFRVTIQGIAGKLGYKLLAARFRNVKNCHDLQYKFIKPFLKFILLKHSDGISCQFPEKSGRYNSRLYISNHRDIVLDAALLALKLADMDMETEEIGIGNNLLIKPWIENIVRLNKCFIVRRDVHAQELMEASVLLSEYIRFTIEEKDTPVWLAQREGRAKDSDDRTQRSVLKMIALSMEGDPVKALSTIHLTPLTISYEYDPCDWLKAKEFQQKRDNPAYKKSKSDDMLNMKTGIFGYKGHIHYHASEVIDEKIKAIDRNLPANAIYDQVAGIIDRAIYDGYRLFPCNYIAADTVLGENRFNSEYNTREKRKFMMYIEKQLSRIDLPNPDIDFLKGKMLEMYANPLFNKLNIKKE